MTTHVFTLTSDEVLLAVASYAAEKGGTEIGDDATVSASLQFRHGRVQSALVEFDVLPTSPPVLRLVRKKGPG